MFRVNRCSHDISVRLPDLRRPGSVRQARGTGIDGSFPPAVVQAGGSGERSASQPMGTLLFDTALNKPIWWTGLDWRDAADAVV